jgi:hypothetical protein
MGSDTYNFNFIQLVDFAHDGGNFVGPDVEAYDLVVCVV